MLASLLFIDFIDPEAFLRLTQALKIWLDFDFCLSHLLQFSDNAVKLRFQCLKLGFIIRDGLKISDDAVHLLSQPLQIQP